MMARTRSPLEQLASAGIPDEPFSGEELAILLGALLETIDPPRRRRDPAGKTLLVDLFGTANAGKTAATAEIERAFRRNGYHVFCPPETAELAEIRNKAVDDPTVFQARHLTGIQQYVLNLAYSRDFHLAVISRGLIDILYWYAKGRREGIYSATHYASVRRVVFEFLRLDLVDAFFFFTCSTDEAIRREYGEAIVQQRGSRMNEQVLEEAHVLYEEVLAEVAKNVPGLPIFRIDTTTLRVREVADEVLRHLAPTLLNRFSVPEGSYLPHSLTLLGKATDRVPLFEEQLKLRGHPDIDRLGHEGWLHERDITEREEVYLDARPETPERHGIFDEIVRVHQEDGRWRFVFKNRAEDRFFSHRRTINFEVSDEEARNILARYPEILRLRHARRIFRKDGWGGEHARFVLHVDTIAGTETFTELKAQGNAQTTHTQDLLELATALGFAPADIIEGSYLYLALAKQREREEP